MTVAERPRSSSRRTRRSGWRPAGSGDFPTLGWHVLRWTYAHLPSPSDERSPFVYTDEQAQRVLRIYELDPETGRRVYDRRVHEEEAKGWGKSPFAGSLTLAEFCGPVLFDGWDEHGQPMARRWGHGGSAQPWIQVAGVSEAQTRNTWGSIFTFVTANEKRAAKALGIEDGRTLLYLRDMPSALMERVTASAGSREGQPLTHAVIDEPQLLTEANRGDNLTRTILRNLTKTGGWAHFTGNAPVLGAGSVAETFGLPEDGHPDEGTLHFATRPSEVPEEDWPREKKLWALGQVYRGVPWVLDHLDRVLVDADDPKIPWSERLRFSFNCRTNGRGERAWMPPASWEACIGDVALDPREPAFTCVRIGHGHTAAAIATAQLRGAGGDRVPLNKEGKPMLGPNDRVLLEVRTFNAPDGDQVDVDVLERELLALRKRLPARVKAQVPVGTRGRMRDGSLRGPEIAYAGAFFAGSAQRFRAESAALVDIPSTPERLTPAAEVLLQLVTTGALVHDGNDELARQWANVTAKQMPKGWKPEPLDPEQPIVAPRAAMLAVHRALTAPRWKPSRVGGM